MKFGKDGSSSSDLSKSKKNQLLNKNSFLKNKKHEPISSNRNHLRETISVLRSQYSSIQLEQIKEFKDFPLSKNTIRGLNESGYKVPTEIQTHVIGPALQGFDILGAAKTGSGKTLAFLVPLIEKLYTEMWTSIDGLGALIITPTRELALQIFETLRKVGRYHDFSAGLIIGGKDLKFERTRMGRVNVVICTPGRLLQHMDETPNFDCSTLKILILDEADRCLDMGFESTMNAIIDNLPKQRQTFLFSATQTKNVKDLVRLSLKDPKYISVHEHEKNKTPDGLVQSYIVCDQHEKLSMLWSFINSHVKSKIMVFFTTCHQVKFFYEIMKQLRANITILALHGKLHQLKRIDVYKNFCSKKFAVLFATDIAARGLDFPEVNWVIQLDCPEDVETYIHRAGRTARYHQGGECLTAFRPSETVMVEYLAKARVPLTEINVNPKKVFDPQAKIEGILAKNVELKNMAQRSFVSYMKAIYFMKDKSVFDVKTVDIAKFARSLGLINTPRIRFLVKKDVISNHHKKHGEEMDKSDQKYKTNDDKEALATLDFHPDVSDEEDILVVKRKDHELDFNTDDVKELTISKKKCKVITPAALAKKFLKKKILPNKKTIFTDDGEVVKDSLKQKISELGQKYEEDNDSGGINIEEAKLVMKEEDKFDKKLAREKAKMKRREEKRKRRQKMGLSAKGKIKEDDDDDFSDSESADSEPDLSWLPDPDKIYGKEKSDDDSNNGSESEVTDNNEDEQIGQSHSSIKSSDGTSLDDGNDSYPEDEEDSLHVMKKDSNKRKQQFSSKDRPVKKSRIGESQKRSLKKLGEWKIDLEAMSPHCQDSSSDTDEGFGFSLKDEEEMALRLIRNS